MLNIVPREQGLDPRDYTARPDWWGSADRPEGPVAEFVQACLRRFDLTMLVHSYLHLKYPHLSPAAVDVATHMHLLWIKFSLVIVHHNQLYVESR